MQLTKQWQAVICLTEIPQFNIEKPANRDNGDYSTNVAMAGACI